MSDQPETLAAVLAEFRSVATVAGLALADRIEAAAEREREAYCDLCKEKDAAYDRLLLERDKAIKASAPGNAAAMRDALNRVGHLAKDLRNITERDTEVRADANEIVDVCRAALSAPARNCDLYASAKDALDAFIREKEIKSADVDNMNLRDFFDWLFDKAEGGDHA